ncbi:MAG: ABC transporter ATP-binding protein [Xanthobacteraceae bacterium]
MDALRPSTLGAMAAEGTVAEPMVRLRGVSKVYRSLRRHGADVEALKPVDLNIASGEFVTIVGPSGCGKSTLLSLIAGLSPSTTGEIDIGGRPVAGPYTDLGIVFQKDLLLPWRTVLGNVLIQAEVRGLDRRVAAARAAELLGLVGLSGFEQFLPHELSGGMRQRVAICRALLHDPPLLLMDEPFAALDAITRDQLTLDFQRFWQPDRRTAVFITHNLVEAVLLGDRVVVMTPRPGGIAEILQIDLGRPRDLTVRDTPDFARYTRRIHDIFIETGILKAE